MARLGEAPPPCPFMGVFGEAGGFFMPFITTFFMAFIGAMASDLMAGFLLAQKKS